MLDEENQYQMVISVNFAGVVNARQVTPQEAEEITK
jgi:hypothetical protein